MSSVRGVMARGLLQAVRDCRYQQVRYMLDSGLSINLKDLDGKNALVYALHIPSDGPRARMVSYLIKRGVRLMERDRATGRDPLLWACCLGRSREAVKILKEVHGDADLLQKDYSGRTALHYAVLKDDVSLVAELCRLMTHHGLAVDAVRDEQGFTPYLLACKLGHQACEKVLVDKGQASTCQFDLQDYQMPNHWEAVGQLERAVQKRRGMHHKLVMYKALGRLPQLKKAKFHLNKVQMKESRKDKDLLSTSPIQHDPETLESQKNMNGPQKEGRPVRIVTKRNEKRPEEETISQKDNDEVIVPAAASSSSSSSMVATKVLPKRKRFLSLPSLNVHEHARVLSELELNSQPQPEHRHSVKLPPVTELPPLLRSGDLLRSIGHSRRFSEADAQENKRNLMQLMEMAAEQHSEGYRPNAKKRVTFGGVAKSVTNLHSLLMSRKRSKRQSLLAEGVADTPTQGVA